MKVMIDLGDMRVLELEEKTARFLKDCLVDIFGEDKSTEAASVTVRVIEE